MLIVRAKDIVNRLAFAFRERAEPGTPSHLLEEDAVSRKVIDGTAPGTSGQGVPVFDDVEVPNHSGGVYCESFRFRTNRTSGRRSRG